MHVGVTRCGKRPDAGIEYRVYRRIINSHAAKTNYIYWFVGLAPTAQYQHY